MPVICRATSLTLLLLACSTTLASEWSRITLDSSTDAEDAPYLDLAIEDRDGDGLKRDTMYFMGYQVAAVAIMWTMPEDVTGWSSSDKEDYSMSKWWNNVKNPGLDSDDHSINYIIHPYWGASYFVRARERGYSGWESFWYSALLSTMFEFGAEALAEEPSYQDLWATPVLGSLVGLWFMDVRDGIRERSDARGHKTTGEKWVWVLTDPLGAMNRQMDKLFGHNVTVELRPFVEPEPRFLEQELQPGHVEEALSYGLEFSVNW